MTTTPTLPAVLSPSGESAWVWCRYCDRFHSHGPEPGNRAAHCFVRDSPYTATGYDLALVAGTKRDLQPPRRDRRPPRYRDRFSGEWMHGWDDERATVTATD